MKLAEVASQRFRLAELAGEEIRAFPKSVHSNAPVSLLKSSTALRKVLREEEEAVGRSGGREARQGPESLLLRTSYYAVSGTNAKLPSFWSSWNYLLKVTGARADDPRRINMIQLSDRQNVPHVIRADGGGWRVLRVIVSFLGVLAGWASNHAHLRRGRRSSQREINANGNRSAALDMKGKY